MKLPMKRSELILLVLQVPIDFFLLFFASLSAYALRFSDWAIALKPVTFSLSKGEFVEIILPVALLWLLLFAFAGLYSTNPNRKLSRDLYRLFLACSAGVAGVALYVMFAQQLFDSRFLVAAGWSFALLYVGLGRIAMRGVKGLLYRFGIGLRRVVVIGKEDVSQKIVDTLTTRRELGYNVVGVFSVFDDKIKQQMLTLGINEMFFTNPRADEKQTLFAVQFCNQQHVTFKYSADLFATLSTNMSVSPLAGIPIVEIKRTRLEAWGRVFKRLFDIAFSLLFLVVTLPIVALCGLIILIETGRPLIYKNERVGIRGKRFMAYKLRSMNQKDSTGAQFGDEGKRAEKKEKGLIKNQSTRTGPIYKVGNDPRVTNFGRFLRRWSLDELPQFVNVLKGEMSLVGPRPHQPREVSQYEDAYPIVFTLKPGVTGMAQISGRSDLSFEEEMRLDALYTEKWSILLDIIIVLKTPFILFKRRKAL
jgi:exopolysaccharide biosynthesis polyprenyl glycosylphosphotransferase